MHKMTQENLSAAFAGESQAHMKYAAFSEKAKQEEKPNVARLFAAASFAEQVHATSHLRVLKGIGSTVENLEAAFGGEDFEVEEMYPAFIGVAQLQQESAADMSFNNAIEAEKIHRSLYEQSKKAMASGKDAAFGDLFVCPVCGHTEENGAPDKCPVCGTVGSRFVKF